MKPWKRSLEVGHNGLMRGPLKSPALRWILGLGLLLGVPGRVHAWPPGAPEPEARPLDADALPPYKLRCDPGLYWGIPKNTLPPVGECDVVVATVVAVRDEGSTRARPPTVLLRVEEVLTRDGDLSPGLVQAVWRSRWLTMPCSVGEEARIARWEAGPQPGPEVGERFLVAGSFSRNRRWFMTVPELRLAYIPENLRAVRAHLQREQEGWTPEHMAWMATRRAEARAAARDDELMAAVAARDVMRVRTLLQEGVRATASSAAGIPALHEAARLGEVAMMEALLDAGAPVDRTEPQGLLRTALEMAASEGHVEAVKLLLARGANLHHLSWGNTPILLTPSDRGHCGVVRVLLAHGAPANQSDKHGGTPLLGAARRGRLDCVIALLEAGARPDQANSNGWRPVHYAIEHPAVLEQLLRAGANPNARSPDAGARPLKMARSQRFSDSVRLLLAAGARER